MSFGRTIRQMREYKGMSLEELATAASIPWATLEQIERGSHFPHLRELERLLAVLGTTWRSIQEGGTDYR